MIVCVCRAVSDRTVKACAAAGARTVTAVGEACGAGTGCGTCHLTIARVLHEVHASEGGLARGARPVGSRAHDVVPAEATG